MSDIKNLCAKNTSGGEEKEKEEEEALKAEIAETARKEVLLQERATINYRKYSHIDI